MLGHYIGSLSKGGKKKGYRLSDHVRESHGLGYNY